KNCMIGTATPTHPVSRTRRIEGESAGKPDSVGPSEGAGRPSIWGRRCRRPRCGQPADIGRAALDRPRGGPEPSFSTLLRVGFTEPTGSLRPLVVSYTTVSPLPPRTVAVCSLWHCPAGRPGSVLPTTLPCGVRTFLDALTAPRPPGRLPDMHRIAERTRRAPPAGRGAGSLLRPGPPPPGGRCR